MTFDRGDRVWYEPSAGLRFAGIVTGPGSIPGCVSVLLTGHYWQWKSRGGQHTRFMDRETFAISVACLTRRDGCIPRLDDRVQFAEAGE